MVIIPGDQPEEGIDGYGGKDCEKTKVLRREWQTPRERSTSGPGSEHGDGEELGDDDRSFNVLAMNLHSCAVSSIPNFNANAIRSISYKTSYRYVGLTS